MARVGNGAGLGIRLGRSAEGAGCGGRGGTYRKATPPQLGAASPSRAGYLRKRVRELAGARVRYGYRRIHILLRPEGWAVNHKRTRRLYQEERLQSAQEHAETANVCAKLREYSFTGRSS